MYSIAHAHAHACNISNCMCFCSVYQGVSRHTHAIGSQLRLPANVCYVLFRKEARVLGVWWGTQYVWSHAHLSVHGCCSAQQVSLSRMLPLPACLFCVVLIDCQNIYDIHPPIALLLSGSHVAFLIVNVTLGRFPQPVQVQECCCGASWVIVV